MKHIPVSFKKFPEDLYRKAKAEAAIRGVTVAQLFVLALKQILNGRKTNGN